MMYNVSGDAEEFLDYLCSGLDRIDRVRGTVVACILGSADSEGRQYRDDYSPVYAEVVSHIRSYLPRTLIIVIEAIKFPNRQDLEKNFRFLVQEASAYARNRLGAHLTTIGIVVTKASNREIVADRIAAHLQGPSSFGDGVVIFDQELKRGSIRQVVGEELL